MGAGVGRVSRTQRRGGERPDTGEAPSTDWGAPPEGAGRWALLFFPFLSPTAWQRLSGMLIPGTLVFLGQVGVGSSGGQKLLVEGIRMVADGRKPAGLRTGHTGVASASPEGIESPDSPAHYQSVQSVALTGLSWGPRICISLNNCF